MKLITSSLLLSVLILTFILSHTSGAALLSNNRKLVVAPGPTDGSVKFQVSPSPSPNPSIELSKNRSSATPESSVKDKGNGTLTDERCEATPYSCHQKNLTACVQFSEKVLTEALLVQNGGEDTLRVHASISPNNLTFTNILLLKSEARKIDVSAILRGNREIILTFGNESCVIHIGLSVPSGPGAGGSFFQHLPYADKLTPIHIFVSSLVTLLIIGGIWAYCKSETSGRQVDGIPYQELEMGQSNSTLAVNIEEGGEGWDEVWDDNWDDDQGEIKSPAVVDHFESNASVNDLQSKSSSKEGWDEDWED